MNMYLVKSIISHDTFQLAQISSRFGPSGILGSRQSLTRLVELPVAGIGHAERIEHLWIAADLRALKQLYRSGNITLLHFHTCRIDHHRRIVGIDASRCENGLAIAVGAFAVGVGHLCISRPRSGGRGVS